MGDNKIKEELVTREISNGTYGITLKEFFSVLLKWKIIVIISGVLFLIIGLMLGFFVDNYQSKVTTIVEFQWDGISKGE